MSLCVLLFAPCWGALADPVRLRGWRWAVRWRCTPRRLHSSPSLLQILRHIWERERERERSEELGTCGWCGGVRLGEYVSDGDDDGWRCAISCTSLGCIFPLSSHLISVWESLGINQMQDRTRQDKTRRNNWYHELSLCVITQYSLHRNIILLQYIRLTHCIQQHRTLYCRALYP